MIVLKNLSFLYLIFVHKILRYLNVMHQLRKNRFILTYMAVKLHGLLQLEQRQVVLEGPRVVLPVHYDPLHVPADGPLALQVARDIELSEHGHQGGQEARLTVRRRHHVFVADEDPPALVLGEKPQPGGLPHQHLPGELAEGGAFAAYDPAGFYQRSDATLWNQSEQSKI